MYTVSSTDGTTIAFDEYGSGPALILVGGAFQHRAIDPRTAELATLLGEHFTVYHYDRRGRGDSGDTAPYSVSREIEDLDAIISHAGGSAAVFGMSSGGGLVLDAATSGVAITKLAVYETPFIVDDTRLPVPEELAGRYPALCGSGRRGEAVELFLTAAVDVPAEVVASMCTQPFWPAFEAVAHTLAYDATILCGTQSGGPLPAQRWAAITAPILAIDGSASPPWLRNGTQAITEVLPHTQRCTLPDQTHAVDPDVLAPVLRDFFAS